MSDEGWHLDKKVPLGLIVAILAQTAAVIWWGSSIDARMSTLEGTRSEQAVDIRALQTQAQRQEVAAATIATQLQALGDRVDEIRTAQDETNALLRRALPRGGVE